MGVWDTGLYSGDFAADLRSTAGAVARLPFDGARLLEIMKSASDTAADDPANEGHATFWLVAADQFAKRGIVSEARERALHIIDTGSDLAMLAKLGMAAADLRKRERVLAQLRATLTAPSIAKKRTTLKKPQPLLFDVGGVYAYRTSEGVSRNPYFSPPRIEPRWNADGYGAMLIVDRGLAFDFLAWYRPFVSLRALDHMPDAHALPNEWTAGRPGTCSSAHFSRIDFTRIATVALDPKKLEAACPPLSGTSAAIDDISLANSLDSIPNRPLPDTFDNEQVALRERMLRENHVRLIERRTRVFLGAITSA